jgi:anaphase-promoting complex subunit 3
VARLTAPWFFFVIWQAVERGGDRHAALSLFDEAVELAPDNALVRYRRAKILASMRIYEVGSASILVITWLTCDFPISKLAVQDLEYLRNSTPEESNVVFQLAKVHRLMGNETKSAQTLAVARDISPKSINKIKKLLETVKDDNGEDKMDEGWRKIWTSATLATFLVDMSTRVV